MPFGPNWMSKCLPKRDELLLRIVFALPKPSMIGFVIISRGAISSATRWPFEVATCEMYVKQIFIASVLPAPDSPEMRIDWELASRTIVLKLRCGVKRGGTV